MANYCECFENNSCNFSLNLNILFDISKNRRHEPLFQIIFSKIITRQLHCQRSAFHGSSEMPRGTVGVAR